MELIEILRIIGRIELFLCAGFSTAFCISYQVITKGVWKETPIGRHIMMSAAMFSVFLLIWVAGVTFGPNNTAYRIAVVAAFGVIPYVQFRQIILLFRAQREDDRVEEKKIADERREEKGDREADSGTSDAGT